jgi:hypothetical protein
VSVLPLDYSVLFGLRLAKLVIDRHFLGFFFGLNGIFIEGTHGYLDFFLKDDFELLKNAGPVLAARHSRLTHRFFSCKVSCAQQRCTCSQLI